MLKAKWQAKRDKAIETSEWIVWGGMKKKHIYAKMQKPAFLLAFQKGLCFNSSAMDETNKTTTQQQQ